MRLLKKILKYFFIGLGSLIGLIVIITVLFMNLHPKFGGSISDDKMELYSSSAQFEDGKFKMEYYETVDPWKGLQDGFNADPTRPNRMIEAIPINPAEINNSEYTRVTWMGHSAFLLEMNGKVILLDPMLGPNTSPVPLSNTERFSELPIQIEDLPEIDVLLLSHDHYDHLDYPTIKKLKDQVNLFVTPLGISAHLNRWGIEDDRIVELDWWETFKVGEIELVSTPAQHFSGRGFFDSGATSWTSWVVRTSATSIYFSGDGGYNTHFKEIGEKYGPFDFAMIECGQYNENWHAIHLFPEETAQVAVELKAKLFMPIHWGSFELAFHDWTDPIERVEKKARELGQPMASPQIGEPVYIGNESFPNSQWWLNYN